MSPAPGQPQQFLTTQWHLVLKAARSEDTEGFAALSELCQQYWYPLYAFVRRSGKDERRSEDLTQGFFEHLLSHEGLKAVRSERGRFRTFLLGALQNFMANQHDRETAQKRGGKTFRWSLDDQRASTRYRLEPVDRLTPEALYERRWALTLIEQVLGTLRAEFAQAHREELFSVLKTALLGELTVSYAEVAREFGTSEGAIKVTVHRLKQRFRTLLMETVAQTVASPGEVEDEIRYLVAALERT